MPVDLTASGLARIDLRFFDDETALTAAFRAGQLDAASGLDPQAAATLSSIAGTRLLRYPSAIFSSVTFNLRPDHPQFADMHFRRAITMAIDRAAIVAAVYGGNAALAETPVPPSSWAFSPASSRGMHDEPRSGDDGAEDERMEEERPRAGSHREPRSRSP